MTTNSEDAGIDQLLRSYFRSEMPSRFPPAPGAVAPAPGNASAWSMISSRFIVAVSLVALMLAYLGLATYFPTATTGGVNVNGSPMIGKTANPALVKPVTPQTK